MFQGPCHEVGVIARQWSDEHQGMIYGFHFGEYARNILITMCMISQSFSMVDVKCSSKQNIRVSPPYAIPYGWWIPNPIYGYGYGVGIVRLMRMVVDMRSEIGESGSEKKLCTLLRSKS